MKYGMRKPSAIKSFKARRTGKAKRAVKKALIPGYGKKGSGWIKDLRKQHITRFIEKQVLGFGICLNRIVCEFIEKVV